MSVAWVIQQALHMRCLILSSLTCLLLYHIFPHYLINGTVFDKKLFNTKCLFWFSLRLLYETFLIRRRIQRDIIINVQRSSYKLPLFLSDFTETWIFSTDFRKILKYQISWKSVHWQRSCSMRTGSQTDMTKLIVVFRNFANEHKKWSTA